ncbi:uncharacterized protein CCOS01_13186 [Colletotrichum costaricense]|uniref:Uncharacterized protein n=1 Tax=Colletotrichum costaricense TaxID=1209916 RepID=A0AAI9YL03_9PEZI|nr:uncharacterized protein CCOS01_13186 [Colletotrichum costaricense]KAK1514993.1 hypothetical protein CCOS01_13186 [Colletotrichum costaricense]
MSQGQGSSGTVLDPDKRFAGHENAFAIRQRHLAYRTASLFLMHTNSINPEHGKYTTYSHVDDLPRLQTSQAQTPHEVKLTCDTFIYLQNLTPLLIRDSEIISLTPVCSFNTTLKPREDVNPYVRPDSKPWVEVPSTQPHLKKILISSNPDWANHRIQTAHDRTHWPSLDVTLDRATPLVDMPKWLGGELGPAAALQHLLPKEPTHREWRSTFTIDVHCRTVFHLLERLHLAAARKLDQSVEESMVTLHDYVTLTSLNKINKRWAFGFGKRNFGSIFKTKMVEIDHDFLRLPFHDTHLKQNVLSAGRRRIDSPMQIRTMEAIYQQLSVWKRDGVPLDIDAKFSSGRFYLFEWKHSDLNILPGSTFGSSGRTAGYDELGRLEFQRIFSSLSCAFETYTKNTRKSYSMIKLIFAKEGILPPTYHDRVLALSRDLRNLQMVLLLLGQVKLHFGDILRSHLVWLSQTKADETQHVFKDKESFRDHVERAVSGKKPKFKAIRAYLGAGEGVTFGEHLTIDRNQYNRWVAERQKMMAQSKSSADTKGKGLPSTPDRGSRNASTGSTSQATLIEQQMSQLRLDEHPSEKFRGPDEPEDPIDPETLAVERERFESGWVPAAESYIGIVCRYQDALRTIMAELGADFLSFFYGARFEAEEGPEILMVNAEPWYKDSSVLNFKEFFSKFPKTNGDRWSEQELLTMEDNMMARVYGPKKKDWPPKDKLTYNGTWHAETIVLSLHHLATELFERMDQTLVREPTRSALFESHLLPKLQVLGNFLNLSSVLAVSKRCCPSCNMMVEVTETSRKMQILRPGDHSDWFSTSLPPWLPEKIFSKMEARIFEEVSRRLATPLSETELPRSGSSGGSGPAQSIPDAPSRDHMFDVMVLNWRSLVRGSPASSVAPSSPKLGIADALARGGGGEGWGFGSRGSTNNNRNNRGSAGSRGGGSSRGISFRGRGSGPGGVSRGGSSQGSSSRGGGSARGSGSDRGRGGPSGRGAGWIQVGKREPSTTVPRESDPPSPKKPKW